jgi:pyruvate,orthophosphate dikinase
MGGEFAFLVGRDGADSRFTPALVGYKAANLLRLNHLGLRVPPAIVLTTAAWREYAATGTLPAVALAELSDSIHQLERMTGLTLGGSQPLVVSVRPSPPAFMPGVLSTIVNLGLTEHTVSGLIRRTGNPWLAWDAYRRLIRSFGEHARGVAPLWFETLTKAHLTRTGARAILELDPLAVRDLARELCEVLEDSPGGAIPTDPFTQLVQAVEAQLDAWNVPAARAYRRGLGLDDQTGVAVIVQAMVFGNAWYRSGSGIAFTRNPFTGAAGLFADFMFSAQGEDILSGHESVSANTQLPSIMPELWMDLQVIGQKLELEFRDMQDFAFTIEDGVLYILQTREGRRTPWAALEIAVDLARSGIIDRATAVRRLARYDTSTICRLAAAPGAVAPVAQATAASIGVAIGSIALDGRSAQQLASTGPVILVCPSVTTEELARLSSVQGIVTTYGARTSHAAMAAREQGKVCLVGCADLRVDVHARSCTFGTREFREGDVITLDGEHGLIYGEHISVVVERPTDALSAIELWRSETQPSGAVPTPTH